MTTCPMCGQRIPVEGCSEHIALCGLDDEIREVIAASAPRTRIRWERGVAGQVAAHLLSDDGGHALVHCMIPGGRPRFLPRPDSRWDTSIVDAPACDSFAAFKRFVIERFGDDDAPADRGSAGLAVLACLAMVLAFVLVVVLPAVQSAGEVAGGFGG